MLNTPLSLCSLSLFFVGISLLTVGCTTARPGDMEFLYSLMEQYGGAGGSVVDPVSNNPSPPVQPFDPSDLPTVGPNQVGVVVINDDDGGDELSAVTGLTSVGERTYNVTVTWNSSDNKVTGNETVAVPSCGIQSFTFDYGSAICLDIEASI